MPAVYLQLLTAVRDRLNTVERCPLPVVRKRAVLLPTDELPVCLVVPGGESIGDEAFTGIVVYQYSVVVVLVYAGDRVFDLDGLAELLEVRERIRDVMYRPDITLSGATAVAFDVEMEPQVPYDFSGSQTTNYDVSAIRFTFKVRQTRVDA